MMQRILSVSRAKWDWLKFKIKTSSITYSKQLAKERKKREEELNFKYQDALNKFQENPSEITRLEMNKFKNELETLYDERVEGIVVRPRARWHEHGEKSSEYFLNLEKHNNIKKHVRKLYLVRFRLIRLLRYWMLKNFSTASCIADKE